MPCVGVGTGVRVGRGVGVEVGHGDGEICGTLCEGLDDVSSFPAWDTSAVTVAAILVCSAPDDGDMTGAPIVLDPLFAKPAPTTRKTASIPPMSK